MKALRYKPEGRGFDSSDGIIGIFHLYNPSGSIMPPGSTHSLTEMSTNNISLGIKAVGA